MNLRLSQYRLASPGLALVVLALVGIGVFFAVRVAIASGPATLEIPVVAQAENAPTAINLATLYEQRVGGVVTIDATFGEESSEGTGFMVDADGYVLTSYHVVVDYSAPGAPAASPIYVEFPAGDRVPARFIGRDHFSDVAVLKIDPSEVEYTPVPLGDSDGLVIGEPVAAIGAPFGNKATLTAGHVSARRSVPSQINRESRIPNAIQTDAAINRGNSGGPLFNARGEVVGINQQINSTSGSNTGISFAIPINIARRSLEQIKRTGTTTYGQLGIRTENVTPQMARQFNLPVTRGAIVQAVDSSSPADGILSSGTRQEVFMGDTVVLGDIVTSIAGVPVRGKEDVTEVVARLDVGATVDVEYYRGGAVRTEGLVVAEKSV